MLPSPRGQKGCPDEGGCVICGGKLVITIVEDRGGGDGKRRGGDGNLW